MLKSCLLCFVSIALVSGQQVDPERFCERYVECAAVATLEERICLGNSKLRPHWLPSRNDPHNCHEKLRNDYIILERLEEKLDQELLSCLLQNTAPFSPDAAATCNAEAFRSASKFDFGRSILYVPNNCFTGVNSRVERECGRVKSCCAAVPSCSSITTTSSTAVLIKDLKAKMRQRAQDCDNGIPISKSPLPSCVTPAIPATQLAQVVAADEPIQVVPPSSGVREGATNIASEGGYDSMNDEFATASDERSQNKNF